MKKKSNIFLSKYLNIVNHTVNRETSIIETIKTGINHSVKRNFLIVFFCLSITSIFHSQYWYYTNGVGVEYNLRKNSEGTFLLHVSSDKLGSCVLKLEKISTLAGSTLPTQLKGKASSVESFMLDKVLQCNSDWDHKSDIMLSALTNSGVIYITWYSIIEIGAMITIANYNSFTEKIVPVDSWIFRPRKY
jgi:hypothetical protein